jgi:hypothetical protein
MRPFTTEITDRDVILSHLRLVAFIGRMSRANWYHWTTFAHVYSPCLLSMRSSGQRRQTKAGSTPALLNPEVASANDELTKP